MYTRLCFCHFYSVHAYDVEAFYIFSSKKKNFEIKRNVLMHFENAIDNFYTRMNISGEISSLFHNTFEECEQHEVMVKGNLRDLTFITFHFYFIYILFPMSFLYPHYNVYQVHMRRKFLFEFLLRYAEHTVRFCCYVLLPMNIYFLNGICCRAHKARREISFKHFNADRVVEIKENLI
jgi:hypothetical protein